MGTEKEAVDEKKEQKVEKMEPDMHLGDILKDTGDCGLFQFGMIFFFAIILVTLTWSMLGMAFEAAIPHWHCVVANDNGTVNFTEAKVCDINGTLCDYYVFDPDMRTIVSECVLVYYKKWVSQSIDSMARLLLGCLSWDHLSDKQRKNKTFWILISTLQWDPWDLVCDKKWVSQTITTIQMAGLLVGGMAWGHVSDGIGRKPTLFLSLFLLGVFNVLSYFSTGWKMFAVMRFFIGIASTGFMSGNITFEYIRNKWRVYLELIPTWATWAGAMAGVCYLLHDWRYLHVIIAAVSFPALLLWFAVPESFRWLVSHGKLSEAEKVIDYVARINRAPASSLSGIRKVVENEQHEAERSKTLQVYTALDLFRSHKIRKVTILFSLIWIFSAFSYYGIAFGVQELSGNLYLNLFLVSIVDIPGNYLLVLFNVWGGRRFTSLGFYFVGGLLALAVGILQYTKLISGLWLNVLALTSKLCISAAWEINTLWAAESFPTVVRNIGNGVLSSVSRIGSIIAPQIINLSMDTPGLLYLGSGIVCLLSSGLSFFLEETKHRDLPDMLPHKHEITNKIEPSKSIQV